MLPTYEELICKLIGLIGAIYIQKHLERDKDQKLYF